MADTNIAIQTTLTDTFIGAYPIEVSKFLESLPVNQSMAFLQKKSLAQAARIMECLGSQYAAELCKEFPAELASELLQRIDAGKAALMLSRLDESLRLERIQSLPATLQKELQTLMQYPDDRAGSLMDSHVLIFRAENSVADALNHIRKSARRRVHNLYIVDDEGKLSGMVPLQEVAFAEPDETLGSIATPNPVNINAMATRNEILETLSKNRLSNVPVLDFEGRLIGVIRHEALVAAAQEEATSDIQTMVGAGKEERALSPALFAVRKRQPWLQINLVTAFLAASVVGFFEDTIAQFTALAVLLPVVAGQSGNTGAQALAVTMRGLALREIRVGQWVRVMRKEVVAAVINGIGVAITTSLGVYLWSSSLGLAMVIGVSMVISMASAGMAGAAVPVALTAAGQDPAQASSIILTTVTDIVGFFSFLGIATLLSHML